MQFRKTFQTEVLALTTLSFIVGSTHANVVTFVIREEFNFNSEITIIGVVGNINGWKGQL